MIRFTLTKWLSFTLLPARMQVRRPTKSAASMLEIIHG